jgi:hypothetical protein
MIFVRSEQTGGTGVEAKSFEQESLVGKWVHAPVPRRPRAADNNATY